MTFRVKTVVAIGVMISVSLVGLTRIPTLRKSVPGRVIRFVLGEPGATQWVNDTADDLSASSIVGELEGLADRIMTEYGSTQSALPPVRDFTSGPSVPNDRVPSKFQVMGGIYSTKPDIFVKFDKSNTPTAFVMSWGHSRQEVVVFSSPPLSPPQSFFSRRVSRRTYVLANPS
jgi:hypothetical protein